MSATRAIACLAIAAACAALARCEEAPPLGVSLDDGSAFLDGGETADPAPSGRKKLGLGVCDPSAGGFSTASTNPYFPMEVGSQWTYEGEEDGVPVSLLITVLDETRLIAGVTARVIEEREWEDDELLEVSWNYFAAAGDGTICYFGEDVDVYEEDEIVHEGAWCAEDSPNAPGIIMPADPRPGMKFPMESAPGIAEDEGTIVGIGPVTVPFGRFDETLRVREFNPLDGGKGFKAFGAGVGLLVDGPVELTDFGDGAPTPGPPTITTQACGS
ncbi:MAG TPA: hypothetical protein VFH82_09110 [Gemmatimonadota bacterium]|nr:hypothetical protein [Gemmatimonadota bacterium]